MRDAMALRMLAIFFLPTVAAAPAMLDWFAEPCTGTGELKAGTDVVGMCFSGSAKVLTIEEHALLRIKSFDAATGEGTMKLDTSGMAKISCPPAQFKKRAQAINVDLSACGPIHKALASAQYCSDQNTVQIHVKVPEAAAPGAAALPHIPVTLKPTACGDAKANMQELKAAAAAARRVA